MFEKLCQIDILIHGLVLVPQTHSSYRVPAAAAAAAGGGGGGGGGGGDGDGDGDDEHDDDV